MRNILYLVTDPHSARMALLPRVPRPDQQLSVVLLQGKHPIPELPTPSVYVVTSNGDSGRPSSPYSRLSYGDLLRMVFEADSVITL